ITMNFINVKKNPKETYLVDQPGKHIFFIYNHSGKINIDINVSNAEVFIYGLFVGRGRDDFYLNTIQHHTQPNSLSDLFIKGVFFDDSRFIYEGLIRLEKQAQNSHAYQKNQNLMMSKNSFIDSRPFLEILANDVFCTHGSTTGRLNKDELQYLHSRGLKIKQAEDLLISGFINDLVLKLKEHGIEEEIKEYTKINNY
ncbi:MAG TPA: SufD family Fe-S cluster assembly protein, partial [Candidatus Nitrosocosmicus sp.]|nr:SufD family Fe-S cluster assembly protein [Candidatus Nitrosocosmicus sp.]